ncbi:hypothetical protein GCK72_009429 [Caenorhabditis remanei]|uniref:Uncharacterized protein n=1 Tax=Caenorhabditis remanei TaxID=31234 RepID=A0A6A5H2J9_CAERE|nr:hypothetical protein GCK72_009429 [Caenorhabditis remanei]KAF1761175.1 hypothetical protein GCK72_009429 [Caenorhabditis remanei]
MDGKRVKLGKCGAGEHDDENVEAGDGEDGDRPVHVELFLVIALSRPANRTPLAAICVYFHVGPSLRTSLNYYHFRHDKLPDDYFRRTARESIHPDTVVPEPESIKEKYRLE